MLNTVYNAVDSLAERETKDLDRPGLGYAATSDHHGLTWPTHFDMQPVAFSTSVSIDDNCLLYDKNNYELGL